MTDWYIAPTALLILLGYVAFDVASHLTKETVGEVGRRVFAISIVFAISAYCLSILYGFATSVFPPFDGLPLAAVWFVSLVLVIGKGWTIYREAQDHSKKIAEVKSDVVKECVGLLDKSLKPLTDSIAAAQSSVSELSGNATKLGEKIGGLVSTVETQGSTANKWTQALVAISEQSEFRESEFKKAMGQYRKWYEERADAAKAIAELIKGAESVLEEFAIFSDQVVTHYERDGGPYTTASIIVIKDKELGCNASYHRLMLIGKDRVAVRILPRHLDEFIKRGNREIGISIGNHPAFLFASAVSFEIGKSELAVANSLNEMSFVRCTTNNSLVPAECELVLEGVITDEFVDEGPFPDITGAYDVVRKQRVIKINRVTHRKNPIYQAILPGGAEHKLLMGMPREATIFREASRVCNCVDVRLTLGGSSWLHAVVKIKKEKEEDGRNALEAAFRGHPSLKHAIVVDEDIDIDDPNDVEWAVATRAQMDQDVVLKPNEYGSSLDPSADQFTRRTCKAGLDATIPLKASRDPFSKAKIPLEDKIRLQDYL